MEKKILTFFSNTSCKYFPCHEGTAEDFNCLFCYCPLYALGRECGGNFRYNADGVKDCSACSLPHSKDGYEHVIKGCEKIVAALREKEDKK